MANLLQAENSLTYYQGWFGTLSENDEDLCEPLKLVLGDNPANFSKAYPEILNVFEVDLDKELSEGGVPSRQISYNGISPDPLLGNSPLKELKCGHSYLIVLKKGTLHTESDPLKIPQFTFATAGTSSYEYKIRSTI